MNENLIQALEMLGQGVAGHIRLLVVLMGKLGGKK